MTNPYVFLVGCPRSGTTLLQRIVDAHPRIAIIPESHWIARYFKDRRGLTPEGLVTLELTSHLLEDARFARLRIGQEELAALLEDGRPVDYSDFVRSVFDVYGKARGKSLVGNKTPGFVRKIRLLHSLWPAARFVHLVRDGRDLCLSVMNWRKTSSKPPGTFSTWKDDPVSTTALWWEDMVRLGREAGRWLGPKLYYEMRYEFLVNHPAEECAALCAFLGLAFDDAMLRFHEGRTKTEPSLDAKHAWLPITPGLRDWRSQMAAEDQERFEAAAGELLEEFGYPRAFPRPRPEARRQVSRIRDLLAQDRRWTRAVPHESDDRPGDASTVGGGSTGKASGGGWLGGRTGA